MPIQTKPIDWGWTNEEKDGLIWVKEPLGEIRMPDLVSHFDWSHYKISCPLDKKHLPLGTVNFKSVFTTAARFLGYEKLLIEQPDLYPIFRGFYDWNQKLLSIINVVTYFVIGDDIASNDGLLMSPDMWRSWIKPFVRQMADLAMRHGCVVGYHSDGDILELMDDFDEMGIAWIDMESGSATDLLETGRYQNIKTITENTDPFRAGERSHWG